MILSVIILAAGQGTRMNSDMPKVFHEVGNYPMICHVLDISQKLKAKSTTVVISNKLKNYKNCYQPLIRLTQRLYCSA